MMSPFGTSSFLLIAYNAMLEGSLFKMGSEVASHPHEAVDALKVCSENEMNKIPYIEFSCLLLKELEGPLPTNVTFALYVYLIACSIHTPISYLQP